MRFLEGIIILSFISSTGSLVLAAEESIVYSDHGRRDPLWKLVSSEGVIISYDQDVSVDDLSLEGIIYDPRGQSLAIINGEVAKRNDKIGLFRILKVTRQRVYLQKGQERFALELPKEE